jgi:ATP-dependent helicase HrpB
MRSTNRRTGRSAEIRRIDWNLRQRIDQLAPTRIVVPSGMERASNRLRTRRPRRTGIAGAGGEAAGTVRPGETPRIAGGRMPLTMHLLSPGGGPLQVTQDLRGFWERTYPEVRKEMKGRYPRHPWPDDPWNAVATHRAKPRGT